MDLSIIDHCGYNILEMNRNNRILEIFLLRIYKEMGMIRIDHFESHHRPMSLKYP